MAPGTPPEPEDLPLHLSKAFAAWQKQNPMLKVRATLPVGRIGSLSVSRLISGSNLISMNMHARDLAYIIKAFEIMKRYQVPVGVGAHRFEPIAFCVREGLMPDFYFKTLHHDRYWSAHPPENRRDLEMYEPNSDDHGCYHDNLFCDRPEATVALMQEVKVPWIAFKVLAAGAIPSADAHGDRFLVSLSLCGRKRTPPAHRWVGGVCFRRHGRSTARRLRPQPRTDRRRRSGTRRQR